MMQETAFRKVVQATMIRDRQHGPVIEINRIQVTVVLRIIRLTAGSSVDLIVNYCFQFLADRT